MGWMLFDQIWALQAGSWAHFFIPLHCHLGLPLRIRIRQGPHPCRTALGGCPQQTFSECHLLLAQENSRCLDFRMPNLTDASTMVKLNVGGFRYDTTLSTLTKFPGSALANMFIGGVSDNPTALPVFLDSDGETFLHLLNFLRRGQKYSLPHDRYLVDRIAAEAEVYGIMDLFELCRDQSHIKVGDTVRFRRETIDKFGERIASLINNYEVDEAAMYIWNASNVELYAGFFCLHLGSRAVPGPGPAFFLRGRGKGK